MWWWGDFGFGGGVGGWKSEAGAGNGTWGGGEKFGGRLRGPPVSNGRFGGGWVKQFSWWPDLAWWGRTLGFEGVLGIGDLASTHGGEGVGISDAFCPGEDVGIGGVEIREGFGGGAL